MGENRLERTSNPVCRLSKAAGGFDSHALPPNDFEHLAEVSFDLDCII
jgi:hypothetical protein